MATYSVYVNGQVSAAHRTLPIAFALFGTLIADADFARIGVAKDPDGSPPWSIVATRSGDGHYYINEARVD